VSKEEDLMPVAVAQWHNNRLIILRVGVQVKEVVKNREDYKT
jgi:hypothetical protein